MGLRRAKKQQHNAPNVSYDRGDFFAIINHTVSSHTDLRGLLEQVSEKLGELLGASHVSFFVFRSDNRYVSSGTRNHPRIPLADVHAMAGDHSRPETMHTAELPAGNTVRRLLQSHRIELVVPLVRKDTLIGYVLVGDQKHGEGYSRHQIDLMTLMSDELSIAVQNALSIEEIRDLNATLQQRIDTATRELRASNTQLQRLDKAKDEFVSMASHQLRTPLTSVKGYISMVLEGDAGPISDAQKHLLGEAFTSSERMVHLINDFLNVSRLQTGRFVIDKRPVDLAKVVDQELDSLRTTASSRNLTLHYDKPHDFPVLNLDEGKIRQVIMNFVDNAIYYSPEKTVITVTLTHKNGWAELSVKDAGIGVPRAEQSQLFSKFYRASNARKHRPDGTGVGLFLTKKVVTAHGGEVTFHSAEGKGSTFGFRLPIARLQVSDTHDL